MVATLFMRAVYATAAPTVIPQGNTRRVMVVWVQLNYLQQLASVLFVFHVHSLLLWYGSIQRDNFLVSWGHQKSSNSALTANKKHLIHLQSKIYTQLCLGTVKDSAAGKRECASQSGIEDILHSACLSNTNSFFLQRKYRRIMLEGETQKHQQQPESCGCYVSWIKLIQWGSTCWAWAAVTWLKIQA